MGNHVETFRPGDSQYYSGQTTEISDGKQQVTYDDSDVENLNISHEN